MSGHSNPNVTLAPEQPICTNCWRPGKWAWDADAVICPLCGQMLTGTELAARRTPIPWVTPDTGRPPKE